MGWFHYFSRSCRDPPKVPKKTARSTPVNKNFTINYNKLDNGKLCHTDEYENDNLVVRRDNVIAIDFNLSNANVNENLTNCKVVLEYDDMGYARNFAPSITNNTLICFDLQQIRADKSEINRKEDKYQGQIVDFADGILKLDIFIPVCAIIGKYNIRVITDDGEVDDENFIYRLELDRETG